MSYRSDIIVYWVSSVLAMKRSVAFKTVTYDKERASLRRTSKPHLDSKRRELYGQAENHCEISTLRIRSR